MKSLFVEHRNDVLSKKELFRAITAYTLGDGFLYKAKDCRNAYYGTSRLLTNVDFVIWQMIQLSQLTKVRILTIPPKGMHKESVRMVTMTHPTYTVIYERMYALTRKSFTAHDLTSFDNESLAALYMDDGYFEKQRNTYRSGICTDCFSEPEQKMLRDVIADRCGVHADIVRYKNRFRLRINRKQTDRLIEVILPHVTPSYYYKLNLIPSIETVTSWAKKLQDGGIVRSLLKNNEYYRNVIL